MQWVAHGIKVAYLAACAATPAWPHTAVDDVAADAGAISDARGFPPPGVAATCMCSDEDMPVHAILACGERRRRMVTRVLTPARLPQCAHDGTSSDAHGFSPLGVVAT